MWYTIRTDKIDEDDSIFTVSLCCHCLFAYFSVPNIALRCWGQNSGLCAATLLALAFLLKTA